MLYISIFILSLPCYLYAQFSSQGKSIQIKGKYLEQGAKSNYGLENIFIFENLSSAEIIYKTDKNHAVKFYSYTQSLSDKTDLSPTFQSGEGEYTLTNLKDHTALVIEDNNEFFCFWLIDYNLYTPSISSITSAETEDMCSVLKLLLDLNSPIMRYRGVAGQVAELDRQYALSYDLQVWSDEDAKFNVEEKTIILTNPGTEITLNTPPNYNTNFLFSGDQYATSFGNAIAYSTETPFDAIVVEGHIAAEQWIKSEGRYMSVENLGGSAPIDINFYGIGNEPVSYFYTWYIFDKENPEQAIARFNDPNMSYTFSQFGDFEVLLEVANRNSSCIDSVSVNVSVAESRLDVPNFMSPRNSNGENTTFKIVHKSIIKYECTIFNRWGVKVYQSSNINETWNGKHNGKYVNPGVYYYSIQAEGADGKKYKLGGDINVL